jgi:hypothetical protein
MADATKNRLLRSYDSSQVKLSKTPLEALFSTSKRHGHIDRTLLAPVGTQGDVEFKSASLQVCGYCLRTEFHVEF